MHFAKLHSFLNRYRRFAPQHGSTDTHLPYRIVTICRSAEAEHVAALVQRLLAAYDITLQSNEPAVQAHLSNITVELMCSVSERAGLVQLVTRLAREISVRSVRWESIPQRSAGSAQTAYAPCRSAQAMVALTS